MAQTLAKDRNGNISYVNTPPGELPAGFTALTQFEIDAYETNRQNEIRRNEIYVRLKQIDIETMRPLRAVQAGSDTQADRDKLADLETEAQSLRDVLATLQ